MGPSYPFRACNSWVKYFQRTHKIKVTFQGIKNEEEEYKVDNQSKNKDEKSTAVGREEKVKQGIQKDVEKKNSKEINVNIVEVLNQPIYKKNVEYFENEDDIETTKHSTKNVNDKKQVSLVNVGLQTSDVLTQTEKIKRDKEINKTQVEIQEVKMEANKEVKEKVNNVIGFKSKYDERKELEQILLNWLSEIRSQRLEINGRKFREKALELHNSLNHRYDFRAQYHWIASFEKRYQVQVISRPRKGESISSEDKNSNSESISLTSKSVIQCHGKVSGIEEEIGEKSSSIVGLDGESVRNCDLASIRDSDSSSSLLKSHLQFGVNNIEIKEPLELFDKGLIREEKVSREVEDDWIDEVIETAKEEGEYWDWERAVHNQITQILVELEDSKLEEEIGRKELKNRQTENIEMRDSEEEATEVSGCGIGEVKARDEEEKLKEEIDEIKECEEDEVDTEDENNYSVSYNLLKRSDGSEKLVLDKSKEERNFDEKMQVDADDIKEENLTDEQVKVNARDEEEKLKEEIDEIKECEEDEVDTEDDENYDSVSYNLLKRSDVSEKLVLDKSKEERNFDEKMQVDADDMKEENLTEEQVKVNKENLATNGEEKGKDEEVEVEDEDDDSCDLFIDLNVSENLIVNETDEEKEVQGKNVNLATMEVFGDEIEEIEKKIMVIECEEEVENVFKEQEVKLGEKDLVTNVEEDQESIGEEEEEENIRNEVKNLDAMGNEENEMIIRKNKTLKQVTFATDVKIINAHHLPTNCPSLESSTFKPVNINMKEYVKILEYKLVFSKCQQFIKDQNIRQYFKRQQIKEFKRAIDVLIDKATSEDDLLDNLLMNKNWAPFGRMFCSEDIARVCEV
ncbi:glutamic acid-rich protein-like [Cotesia glomerata]|uniref:glutamic acid-rich protein-like n=1 Tax=Cotesia glomerata TaxID=32391 RepID=UPI001D023279|nr:glutamic acid-rich protein-like [Cotesia glomerata]